MEWGARQIAERVSDHNPLGVAMRTRSRAPVQGCDSLARQAAVAAARVAVGPVAGGEIIERLEFPGGRRFHFADPSGNELAVGTKVE